MYSYSSQRYSTFLIENESLLLSGGKHFVVTTTGQQRSVRYTFEETKDFLLKLKQKQEQQEKDKESTDKTSLENDRIHHWIDLQGLDEREINILCNLMGIHYLTKKDIINQGTREKCEFFQNHIFIVVNEIHYEEGSNNLVSGCLNIVLFKNFVMTFHRKPLISTSQVLRMISYSPTSKFIQQQSRSTPSTPVSNKTRAAASVFTRLRSKSGASTQTINLPNNPTTSTTTTTTTTTNNNNNYETGTLPSAPFIVYSYLDVIIDIYTDLVDKLMMETRSLDDLIMVLSGLKQDELHTRIGLASKRVTNLHGGVFGKNEIISILLRADEKIIPKFTQRYLRNVQDHTVRLLQKLILAQKLLGNLSNIYMARVSLEVSNSSNSIDRSMRKFTAISTIFTPMSMLAGIMGMNVNYPGIYGEPGGDNYFSFIGIISFMCLFALSIAFLFKRSGWL